MPLASVRGVRGRALSHARPPVLGECGRGALPTGCGCGGCWLRDPSPSPQRALLQAGFARCVCGSWGPGWRCLLPGCGAFGVGRSPTPGRLSLGHATRAHYPLAVGAGGVGVETRHQPHSARSCKLALRAVGPPLGRQGGGASCLHVGRPGLGARPRPTARPSGGRPGARYPLAVGQGAVGVGTRHQAHSARSCELALRFVGAARVGPGGGLVWFGSRPVPDALAHGQHSPLCRHDWARPGGGGLLPGCGVSGVGRSSAPDRLSFMRAAGARFPLPVGAGCGWGGPVSLAPSPVPGFVVCCARSPGMRHPAAVVARHLSLCLGCGRRRASLACLLAPRGAPRLVRSGRARC